MLYPNPNGALRAKGAAKKALITFKPEPGFTEEALDNDVYGVVRLRAILSASGEVTDISVVKGLPDGLTEKAIAAARQIRFQPAEKDGRPVSASVVLEYNFNLYDDGSLAKIVEQPEPGYTEEARRNRVTGKVVLDVYLRRDGTVASPRVLEGLPHGLSEKAVEAALRIKFIPAKLQGRKVTVVRTLEYTFKLD
jgi:TonB family protein